MDIAIGLPNTLHIKGPDVVEWARRAEERGFSSLATIDRIVYPSYDSPTPSRTARRAPRTRSARRRGPSWTWASRSWSSTRPSPSVEEVDRLADVVL